MLAALPGWSAPISKTLSFTTDPYLYSLFAVAGTPGAGASPGTASGASCDDTTAGALRMQNAAGGSAVYLAGGDFFLGNVNDQPDTIQVVLFDRLVHTSELSGTSLIAQTVNSAALPARASSGEGVEAWMHVWSALGTTNATLTVTYTNTTPTGSRTGTITRSASGNFNQAGAMFPMQMQSGDTGVVSIQSAIWSGTTGTAGNFGFVLAKRIATLTITPTKSRIDWHETGLPQVDNDACLFAALAQFGTNLAFGGEFRFVYA